MSELSDELLVAYVDGQLARAQSVAVKRVVEFDDVASERVVSLRDANKRMEDAFEAMLREKPEIAPDGPQDQPAAKESAAQSQISQTSAIATLIGNHGRLVMAAVATATALLLLGGALGYMFNSARTATPAAADTPSWQREIAQTQALFGRETLEVSLESQGNPDLVRFQLASAIGPGIVIPNLDGIGLRFVRAQLLRRSGAAIAQMSYLPKEGLPIALFAKAHAPREAAPARSHAEADVQTRAWVHEGIAYVLAANLPANEMARLTSAVERRIAAP